MHRPGAVVKVQRLRPHTRGFTLIELLVVVGFLSLICAIAIPFLLSALNPHDAAEPTVVAEQTLVQSPPRARVLDGAEGRSAEIEALKMAIDLHTEPVLDGFRVHTGFTAKVELALRVRNPDPSLELVELDFPFPPGLLEAREVELVALRAEDSPHTDEVDRVDYSLEGIRWRGRIAPGEALDFRITYAASGRERLDFDVAGESRSGEVEIELKLADSAGIDTSELQIPADALQPSEVSAQTLRWSFDKLLTASAIAIELPAASSPVGRMIALCQLAGLGVLLFGAGLWFLAEGYRPGVLDDFRWGHFLLAALNYVVFFVIFAVVAFFGRVEWALILAPSVALPLLGLHLRRVIDLHFALVRALPMAALTLVVVVAGVYLEDARPYVLLSAGVFVVGFVTVSFESWSAGRLALAQQRRDEAKERERSAELAAQRELLALARGQSEALLLRARAELERRGGGRRARLEVLGAEAELLEQAFGEVDELLGLLAEGSGAGEQVLTAARRRAGEQVQRLAQQRDRLGETLEQLELEQLAAQRSHAEAVEALARAVDRGAELLTRHAELREATLSEALRVQLDESRQLLAQSECPTRALQLAHEACERELIRLAGTVAPSSHCTSCGSAALAGSAHCPDCGSPRPFELRCGSCPASTAIPEKLLGGSLSSVEELYCHACGEAVL